MDMSADDLEREIVDTISQEKTDWETATAFITDRVSYNIRPLLRRLKKNYFGVFEQQIDPTTGREKTWVPLTESFVEAVVKNIDLDTKDINIRAKKASSIGIAAIIRSAVKNELDKMNFGEYLDDLERQMAIHGTGIWHTSEIKKKGYYCVKIRHVDPLNFYIDPTAPSIQEANAVIERVVLNLQDFKNLGEQEKWANLDKVRGDAQTSRYDSEFNFTAFTPRSQKLVEYYVRTGYAPLYYITGKKEDTKEVNMEIVCSFSKGQWLFHGAKKLKTDLKPYEEAWYTRVPNRWWGRGVAEKLIQLQEWINTLVNIRITRSSVAQLGIFKIRRGSGITQQMISRLAVNGAILVNDQQDIEQFQMQDASPASYNDENIIKDWSQRTTSAYEVATGESLPSSTSATAVGIQSQGAQSSFTLVKEGLGMFLQRWMERHALPIIMKNIKRSDIIRLTGDVQDLTVFDEKIANYLLYQRLDEVLATGALVDPQQVELERQRIIGQLSALGADRYVQLQEEIDWTEFDVQVYVTNEEFDKGTVVQNLISMLQVVPAIPQAGVDVAGIVRSAMDIMGLDTIMTGRMQPNMAMPQPMMQPPMSGQETTTAGNTQANATVR